MNPYIRAAQKFLHVLQQAQERLMRRLERSNPLPPEPPEE